MTTSQTGPATAKPRVLCIIETIGAGGGAEQLMADLLPELAQRGLALEIAALFPWPDNLRDDLESRGIPVHLLDFSRRWAIVGNTLALRRLARERGINVFWGHLYFGNFYASLLAASVPGGKSISTIHSEGYLQAPPKGLKARVSVEIERLVLRNAAARVAVSQAVARDYAVFFGLKAIDIVHNGIVADKNPPPPSPEERSRIRASLGAANGDFLVVVPARFVRKKGHAALLDALAILKRDRNWVPRVALFGEETPLLPVLRARAEELGLADRISFSGTIRQTVLFPIIQSADIVCIPSLREPFGIAAAEAMSLGAAVLLTATDGFVELVGDSQAALMVPPGDPQALADALWRLYQQPELRRDLAARAETRSKCEFGIAACADRWAVVLKRVAATTGRARLA